MRNGCLAVTAEQFQSVQQASEMFLGKFAAECLISRADALDRIARDMNDTLASWSSSGGGQQTTDK